MEYVDVLIVGAGISGIGAAWHLKKRCPGKTLAIFEARDALGGTWDLFRYPGVRSDSDMFTLGYAFRPWTEAKAIADGPSILKYLEETVAEGGLAGDIRYRRKVVRASWDSGSSRWTVEFRDRDAGRDDRIACTFLFLCTGYYNYEQGWRPKWQGEESFAGAIVHPQFWPAELDYAGKKVVVIGSGATAMTLVPAMARTAARVTMLQRSPTYVVSMPAEDRMANRVRKVLPARLAYALVRWRNILFQLWFFRLTRRRPEQAKKAILDMARAQLPAGYPIERHFTPTYNPWDQRLCLIPDADLFEAIRAGKVEVVTDRIDCFTPTGIRVGSGQELPADIIVTATGLDLQLASDIEIEVDGERGDLAAGFSYKAMMYSGVPNLASTFGYTNASWTLKADLTAEYVCRLINHMERKGFTECRPVLDDPEMAPQPWLDFTSGYVQRAMHRFPKQGPKAPWRVHQNYALDVLSFRFSPLEDGVMRFSGPAKRVAKKVAERALERA
ncbi:MAG TPA: NAD(P)/FAD-dependent oxidoreductase [Caulobacteraceae bacterium]|nr:NAD(P)/FAD-dependent oxidoreductase [Caulobacteraceae bacterium]